MRIAGTLSCSLVNGYGVRYVIFCQGCSHNCVGCQNPETWDFNGGKEITPEELVEDIKNHKHIDGVTLSGGDPFFQQDECVSLLKLLPKNLNIWIYTGFNYEEIKDTELAQMAEDNHELVKSLNIMQAPTIVIGDKKLEGLGTIYHYFIG